jgi:hypothetical protein
MKSKGLKENKPSECGGTSLMKHTFVKHTDPLFFIYIVIKLLKKCYGRSKNVFVCKMDGC